MLDKFKQKELEDFLNKYGDCITRIDDITAGEDPKLLFYFLINKLGYLLSSDPNEAITKEKVEFKKRIFPYYQKLAKSFLYNPQVFENRKQLSNPDTWNGEKDDEIIIPDEPVIWVANHSFKDDTLASILSLKRNAHILFGSLPQFFNSIDGITANLVGVVMVNRNNHLSRSTSIEKSIKVMESGADMFIFPEGNLNKTPNELMIDLWPGVYKLAKATGAKIVPMAHYIYDPNDMKNKNNPIHTVLDDPFSVNDLNEEEGLQLIRDTISGWFYKMMELYGQSTRNLELGYCTPMEVWDEKAKERVKTVGLYDKEVETSVAYKPKSKVRPEDVWQPIADISPELNHYAGNYPMQLVKTRKNNNYREKF